MALKNDPVREVAKALAAAGARDLPSIHAGAERRCHADIDEKMRKDRAAAAAQRAAQISR